jgi:hypothetical protein
MAPRPTSAAPQPPPDLPNMPDVGVALTGYLRNFALWCRNGFADRLPANQALPGILLQAYDATPGTNPKVFLVRVNTAGAISATAMDLGGGSP